MNPVVKEMMNTKFVCVHYLSFGRDAKSFGIKLQFAWQGKSAHVFFALVC